MGDRAIILQRSVDQLPVNRTAQDLVERISSPTISIAHGYRWNCDVCRGDSTEFLCQTCSKSYCTPCLELSHTLHQCRTHSISATIDQHPERFCSKHRKEKTEYYCARCEQIICNDCLSFEHKNHPFVTLAQVASQTKKEYQSSVEQLLSMKDDLLNINTRTTEAYEHHQHIHRVTVKQIETTISHLQALLETRKQSLIDSLTKHDEIQQRRIVQYSDHLEEQLKSTFVRELLLQRLLNTEDPFQVISMKEHVPSHDLILEQQYGQLIQGSMHDRPEFSVGEDLKPMECQIGSLGVLSNRTFLIDADRIQPSLNLSLWEGEEKQLPCKGNDLYGYRFSLTKPMKISAVRVKAVLFGHELSLHHLNLDDILMQTRLVTTTNKTSTTLKWITIPIDCELKNSDCIFISISSHGNNKPLLVYRDFSRNSRKINEQLSIRSKRAELDNDTRPMKDRELTVLYDTLWNDDEPIPAIDMILDA